MGGSKIGCSCTLKYILFYKFKSVYNEFPIFESANNFNLPLNLTIILEKKSKKNKIFRFFDEFLKNTFKNKN